MVKGKKRKIKICGPIERDSYGRKYVKSTPILNDKDLKAVLSKPIETSVHAKSVNHTHIQIVNGVVCSTGKYSRLEEDYDDR